MSGFKIGTHTVDLDQRMPVRLVYEAEKALGMGMEDSGTARVAVYIFVSLRKTDPERSAALIADEVLDMDLAALEDADLDVPLPAGANGKGLGSPPSTGRQPSDRLASPSTLES